MSANDRDEYGWFELESHKGTPEISTFRGMCRQDQIRRILSNELLTGWLKIERTYWTEEDEEGDEFEVVCFGDGGEFEKLEGTLYLRIEHIVSISLMTGPDEGVLEE